MRPNLVKRKLRAGEPAIGTFLGLGSPLGAEQLAHAGFDWLLIDQEHGAIDAPLLQSLLQAISTTDTVPLVRVPWNRGDWIKRALDAGAYGVMVPMVNTREDAEAAVRATRYPPQGDRSIGGARTRLYGGPDYVEQANEEIFLVVQIEHRDAVRNAREILSVPGIDAYFIGPGDLCSSLGLPNTWEPDFPEFWAACDEVARVAKELGVPAGIHASPGRAVGMIERGYRFVAVGYDVSYLAGGAAAAVQAVRAKIPAGR